MKKNPSVSKFKLLSLFFILTINLQAQHYVVIPDTNFVKHLTTYFPSCMNGNMLDTTCTAIKGVTYLNLDNKMISDLTGIQYFERLERLNCNNNLLITLEPLPKTLCSLECSNNKLTFIPPLNSCMIGLMCANNQLTSLPEIPHTMQMLVFNNNQITCLPPLGNSLYMFVPGNNPIKCVSNYINVMDSAFRTDHPICKENDSINNPYKCSTPVAISGYVYKDDGDCLRSIFDMDSKNTELRLYDTNGQLLTRTSTFQDGYYEFKVPAGTYKVEIDTAGLPFDVSCPYPGTDTIITIDSWTDELNFNISCIPGFDLGIQSVSTQGLVFPGQQHALNVLAGNIAKWYNLECTVGVSGEVKITVSGPVTYAGIPPGALTPSISGNVYTYTVNSFGTITPKDFTLLFNTDVTAQISDRICVTAEISSTIPGDENPVNNVYKFCYNVVNSYDPNIKEVDPVDVSPGYDNWFTYTIHFQNTGNAPAINIVVKDTLDNNLDLETFQVLNYSHYAKSTLQNKFLEFNFMNIQLPDSTSNPKGSEGFIQYRIKPKSNLPAGTEIKNKASIYFDYNAPIVTNTTVNHFTTTVNISNEKKDESIRIYPNPGNGNYDIELAEDIAVQNTELEVYTVLGEKILHRKITSKRITLDLNSFANGIYIVKILGIGRPLNQRLIKQ